MRRCLRHILYKPLNITFGVRNFLLLIYCLGSNFIFAQPPFNKPQSIVIQNTQPFERAKEVIAISRMLLGKISNDVFPLVKDGRGNLTNQLVDKNRDGAWDELLVEVSLKPYAKDTLTISWIKTKIASPPFTSVRLSLKSKTGEPMAEITSEQRVRGFKQNIADPYYQMEGPGIENDKVAFRAFFDYRNGKDIYGKIVDTPILKQVGVKNSWHDLQPWGMDIFHTGNSLGAGGLATKEAGQLYRLADADTSTFTKLYEGALEAAFSLRFKNWDVGGLHQNGSETVFMVKGTFFYKNEIEVPLNAAQNLVAGLANFGIDNVVYAKQNSSFSSVSTYGKQAEGTNTNLGVAILFSTRSYVENKTTTSTDSIPNTSYVVLKPSNNGKQTIYFIAGWEKTDARFATQEGFDSYVKEAAEKLAHPIQIKMIK